MSVPVLGSITTLLYLASGIWLGMRLARGAEAAGLAPWLPLTPTLIGSMGHAYVLTHTLFSAGGIDLSFVNAASLVAWLVVMLLLAATTARPVASLGIALLPTAALALATQLLFPAHGHLLGHLPRALQFHILISVTAYSLFAIAAVQAILLAIQDRHLHNRHPGGFIRALPPLASMERLLFQMIGIAFVLLTLGLISGSFFLEDILGQHLAHKTVFSVAAWIIFATLLWGRRQRGWRGRKAIRWTLIGFVLLALAFLGTKLVLELILKEYAM
ncbi:cytochrome C assembly family protein [Endothiovibrio diazotrophicus]